MVSAICRSEYHSPFSFIPVPSLFFHPFNLASSHSTEIVVRGRYSSSEWFRSSLLMFQMTNPGDQFCTTSTFYFYLKATCRVTCSDYYSNCRSWWYSSWYYILTNSTIKNTAHPRPTHKNLSFFSWMCVWIEFKCLSIRNVWWIKP